MQKEKLIISLQQLKEFNYHFTDYEFKEIEENYIINETRRKWLMKEYCKFIDDLKVIIIENNQSNELKKSIKKLLKNVVPENYLKAEYKLMLYKINEIIYFNFGFDIAIKHFAQTEIK